MKKPGVKLSNTILAFGMLLIFAGVLLALAFAGKSPDFVSWGIPVGIFLAGLAILYSYIAFSRSPFKLFSGLSLSFFGIFSLVLAFDCFSVGLEKLWPFFVILTALSLLIAARTTGKVFAINYDLLALSLFILGIVFLLFSFNVIKMPLSRLALLICPLTLILAGTFLVILFFHRKSLLEILPEDMSKELKNEPNFTDTEE